MPTLLVDLVRAAFLVRKLVTWGSRWLVRPLLGRPRDMHLFAIYLRLFIEDMGVTYVKLGQYLALRLDILPPVVCAELNALFSDVPPVDSAAVRRSVEAELGKPCDEIFTEFGERAIGSASIAQVHRVRTVDGRTLALKVQRPGVQQRLEADIRNLRRLGWLVDRLGLAGGLSVVELIEEIAEFSLREVDFALEGRVAEQIGATFPSGVRAPAVHWDLTTPRLLAMEYVPGISVLELARRSEQGEDPAVLLGDRVDPHRLVDRLAEASLSQLFVTGLFHGDPHPANIVIDTQGTIVFLDFGIFGLLTRNQLEVLRGYIQQLAQGNFEAAYASYTRLTEPGPDTDRRAYRRDMISVLREWYRQSEDPATAVAQRLTAKFESEVLEVMRRHGVRMHSNQLLFWRALALLDATAHRLPGRFDLLLVLRRFFQRIQPSPAERLMAAAAASSAVRIHAHRSAAGSVLRVRCEKLPASRRTRRLVRGAMLVPIGVSVAVLLTGPVWLPQ